MQSPIELLRMRPENRRADRLGPRAALRRLQRQGLSKDEKEAWIEGARVDAILGNCNRSLDSVKSGIRCYLAFAGVPTMLSVVHYFCIYAISFER